MIRFTFTIITLLFIATLSANETLLPPETVTLTPVKITPSNNYPCIEDSNCLPLNNRPQKILITPLLLQQSITLHRQGKSKRNRGIGLFIPGAILTTTGTLGVIIGIAMWPRSTSIHPGTAFGFEVHLAAFIPGVISLLIGVPMMVAGGIKMRKGNTMMDKANDMKKKSYKFSFNITPIIAPKTKTYGLLLSMNY